MNIIVLGCNGQLGRCIQDISKKFGQVYGFTFKFLNSKNGDITDSKKLAQLFADFSADVVINASAYTAVDKAESVAKVAYAVNAEGPKNIAQICSDSDIVFIHVSTDYVFDGNSTQPYQPNAVTNPQSVYGASKLAGEQAIQTLMNKFVIIRTAWVFSEYGNNFVKTMLRLANERNELGIVADQKGCPTYAGDLAVAILDIVVEVQKGKSNWGIYHYCGDKETTWYEFANQIFKIGLAQKSLLKQPVVNAITTKAFPTPAVRPKYSVMDNSKIIVDWGVAECGWDKSLSKVIFNISVSNDS
ncbi:dTDP-4-dehydrorhamnose reductase [Candidatus Colwellia aromaticivorans]|uniref:dTDP-4-dehydrorhamnose reductase n=1 Tax=Candidatus Colwellia aromaticivorans TaxID=2267621 RepID=UPI000DF32635|nr:dTDP-4-dehydrorhamnose reductase [Candidatus Colwellia aromaticivorans]